MDEQVSRDPLQVDLQDDDLLAEVELTASLMVAANQSDRPLSVEQIDTLLGLPDPSEDHRADPLL